jgi:hypothetical protein
MSAETPNPTPDAPNGNGGETALATAAPGQAPSIRPPVEFDADNPVALYMDPSVFDQVQRVAKLMASTELVPAHLRGKTADCFLVVAQAFRWRMDPFAVAQHTFVYQGKLGYEGKLVAAVINSDRRVEQKLDYLYSGEGANRKVVVTARLRGENKDRSIDGMVKDWKTQNDKWASMPDQMLSYRGAREWARRHAPEILLGVATEDEVRETVTLVPGKDGSFAAPPAAPDPLLAAAAPAASPAAVPVDHASHSEKEIPLAAHPADAAGAEKEPPTIVNPPVTPPPTPEPSGTGPFAKAVAAVTGRRPAQKTLEE